MKAVIDLSKYQGTVDFHLMRSRNVEGVICRAGNGVDPDPSADTYIPAAKTAGLKTGVYWFCNPRVGTAQQQAQGLAAAHNRLGCELPPMLDVESFTNEKQTLPTPTPAEYAAWLHAFVAEVEGLARRPFFYSNAAYWNPNVADPGFGSYDIIVARYPFYSPTACAAHVPPVDARDWDEWIMAETSARPQVPTGWSMWSGWQFSAGYNARGHTYGVSSTDVDLNIVRDDVWERWLTTPIAPTIEGTDMPAVIKNTEPYDIGDGHGPYDPGVIHWEVIDGAKVHIPTVALLKAYGGTERAVGLSNTELDQIPDRKDMVGELIESGPMTFTGHLGSVPGDITLTAG